ncbi:HEPN domain-containing protein [Methanobacterium bryantii]|uniref:HEPN domain-containing protein n=1 Tax=Methanobacterium bryantii TaxID=2161 RepID=UPI001C53260D|nr:HEPN domain-containing protein [Methanobacterium bryantii]
MVKNSDEKLLAAKTLFESGFYGDAVSRAYYAMFFAAVEKSEIFRAAKIQRIFDS